MTKNFAAIAMRIRDEVGVDVEWQWPSIPSIEVQAGQLARTLTILRARPDLRFDILTDIVVVDYSKCDPRFEVNFLLMSLHCGTRLNVRIRLDESDTLDSVAFVYRSAIWRESEIEETFGIAIRNRREIRHLGIHTGEGPLRQW